MNCCFAFAALDREDTDRMPALTVEGTPGIGPQVQVIAAVPKLYVATRCREALARCYGMPTPRETVLLRTMVGDSA